MAERRPVVAIPPSYNKNEDLETDSTKSYLNYLKQNGAECVMTTAGTSQFNLLNTEEVHTLNEAVSSFEGQKILGVPALPIRHTVDFIKQAKDTYLDENSSLMVLYPDRYYYDSVLERFLETVTDHTDKVYLHTPKMRNGKGGDYEYSSRLISCMFTWGLAGIKEENSSLQQSYDFVRNLPEDLDVIVAGGSMRRFQFLESAGANSFLAGIGNLFPDIENKFLSSQEDRQQALDIESKFFDVTSKIGWHPALRSSLKEMGLTCFYNRQPWPELSHVEFLELATVIKEVQSYE